MKKIIISITALLVSSSAFGHVAVNGHLDSLPFSKEQYNSFIDIYTISACQTNAMNRWEQPIQNNCLNRHEHEPLELVSKDAVLQLHWKQGKQLKILKNRIDANTENIEKLRTNFLNTLDEKLSAVVSTQISVQAQVEAQKVLHNPDFQQKMAELFRGIVREEIAKAKATEE